MSVTPLFYLYSIIEKVGYKHGDDCTIKLDTPNSAYNIQSYKSSTHLTFYGISIYFLLVELFEKWNAPLVLLLITPIDTSDSFMSVGLAEMSKKKYNA